MSAERALTRYGPAAGELLAVALLEEEAGSDRAMAFRQGRLYGPLAGSIPGRRQEHHRPVHGGGQRNPPAHPGRPQQLAGLRPGADRVQAAAMRASPAHPPGPEPETSAASGRLIIEAMIQF
jgi:hypothetical protein